ncbi:MAG: tetratricopeptide repeat protein [Thermodesulfobacteriota bacterium]
MIKKSTTIVLVAAALIAGFIGGVFFSTFSRPAPGLGDRNAPLSLNPPPKQDGEEARALKAELTALEEAIRKDPQNVRLYIQAGNLLFDHDVDDEALPFYDRALEIGGENPDVLTDAGICWRRLGDSAKAVEYFRRARKADPKHGNSALNLGIVLFHDLQDTKGALEAWREYLLLNPQGERAEMIRRVVSQIESRSGTE